jgi:Na+/H+-translocating membrane pyrophosphatase
MDDFERHLRIPVVHVDASDRFLRRRVGMTDPAQKRRIVGDEFIGVFTEQAHELRALAMLKLMKGITAIPTVVSQNLAVGLTSHSVSPERLFAATFVGLPITGFTAAITEYYTSVSFGPVKAIANVS